MASQEIDVDTYTKPYQFTKAMHRDLYPAINPSNPSLNASGKVVIITGASGGIGGDVAIAWATAGADGIVLVGRNQAALDETYQAVKAASSSRVLVHKLDVTSNESVKGLFETVSAEFGKTEYVLVHAAGTMNKDGLLLADIDPAIWWVDFETNIKGTFLTTRHFIKAFGGNGTIINVASLGASFSIPTLSSYCTSKLAVIKLGESIHLEYPNIRLFTVHPGLVNPTHRGMVVPGFMQFAKDKGITTGGLTLYLATPAAEYLRGRFITVNWDIEEMAAHKDQIAKEDLLKLSFLNTTLGPDGYPWET